MNDWHFASEFQYFDQHTSGQSRSIMSVLSLQYVGELNQIIDKTNPERDIHKPAFWHNKTYLLNHFNFFGVSDVHVLWGSVYTYLDLYEKLVKHPWKSLN